MGVCLLGGDMKLSEMTKSLPDPRSFWVVRAEVVNNHTIAEVIYHDVEHLGGRKILVFVGDATEWLKATEFIDPHFGFEEHAPIARFNPAKAGWIQALKFCNG